MRIFMLILDFIAQMICFFSGVFTAFAFFAYAFSHEGNIIFPLILLIALIFSAFLGGYYYLEESSGAIWKQRWLINGLLLSLVIWPALVFFGAVYESINQNVYAGKCQFEK